MTPEQLAQDAAAKAERLAIEKARESLGAFAGRLHRHLDERTERNCQACPHLNVTTRRYEIVGTLIVVTCCDACGLWLPESAAGEGDAMSEEALAKFHIGPIRANRAAGERRPPLPVREKPKAPPMSPKMADWLRENAPHLTGAEVAHAIGCCYQEARKRCHEVGVRWKERPKELQPNAADGFEPTAAPPGDVIDSPVGTLARIEKLRERAEKGLDLWGGDDGGSLLPRCTANIETPKTEAVL